MKEYCLDKNDLNKLKSLFRININIHKIYSKLSSLEVNGKKNTEEYKKYLDYLSIFIEAEDKIYNDINNNMDKVINILRFLFSCKINNELNFNGIINRDDNILFVLRIVNTLLLKITCSYKRLMNLSDLELAEIIEMTGIKTKSMVQKDELYKCIVLKTAIEKDFMYLLLAFLQEYINDFKQTSLRENLITEKYNTIFINKEAEMVAIMNEFNIQTTSFISSDITAQLLGTKLKQYEDIKNSISSSIVNRNIYELLEISDMDYNDIDKVCYSILRQSFLRAAFLFMSDEKIGDINSDFHEYIEDQEYQDLYPNNNVSMNLIIQCFNSVSKDRANVKILSLKDK